MEYKEIQSGIAFLPAKQAVLVQGPPGAGKSSMAVSVQLDVAKEYNIPPEEVVLEVVDLNAHLPEDLSGYPKPDGDHVERLPEKWMRNLSQNIIGDNPGVLVLDDISQTPQSMQAAVFRVALERKAGGTELGTNVRVIITANRRSDKAGAGTLLSPLVSRCWTVTLLPDLEGWLEWAANNTLDPRVMGFIRLRPKFLSLMPKDADDEGRFPSPRSWEFVARAVADVEDKVTIFNLSQGFVGNAAVEFTAFCEHYHSLPDPLKALKNPKSVGKITDMDRLNAVLMAIVDTAFSNEVDAKTLVKAIGVISDGRKEFAARAISHALTVYGTPEIAKALRTEAKDMLDALSTALGE